VRRFLGKPKKTMFFENQNTQCYFLRKTVITRKNGGKRKKLEEKFGILLKSNHTYTSLLQMNQVLAFTHKKLFKEILFEI
jgi:hypothetical protein